MTSRPLLLAIVATLCLGAFKLAVALWSGSQALLASAADSLADAGVSAFNMWMMLRAAAPADDDHPFGHGKAEALATLVQGIVLAAVVSGVGVSAVRGLLQEEPSPVDTSMAGLAMGVSLLASLAIAATLSRAAERTGSLVLKADAVHYRMDFYTGTAVLLGLLATRLVGDPRADVFASLVVCGIMGHDVVGLLRDAVGELMDRQLPVEEQAAVEEVLGRFRGQVRSWHELRTRRSGPRRFVQLHLVLPADLSFSDAHDLSDAVADAIRASLPDCEVLVHADPEGHDEPRRR